MIIQNWKPANQIILLTLIKFRLAISLRAEGVCFKEKSAMQPYPTLKHDHLIYEHHKTYGSLILRSIQITQSRRVHWKIFVNLFLHIPSIKFQGKAFLLLFAPENVSSIELRWWILSGQSLFFIVHYLFFWKHLNRIDCFYSHLLLVIQFLLPFISVGFLSAAGVFKYSWKSKLVSCCFVTLYTIFHAVIGSWNI